MGIKGYSCMQLVNKLSLAFSMSTTLVWPMLNGSDVRCLNLRLRRKKLTVWTYRLSGCWIMETCLDWDLLVSKIHLCDGLKIFVCIEPACCASWECPKHVVECLTQLLLHLLMCFVSNHFSFAFRHTSPPVLSSQGPRATTSQL